MKDEIDVLDSVSSHDIHDFLGASFIEAHSGVPTSHVGLDVKIRGVQSGTELF